MAEAYFELPNTSRFTHRCTAILNDSSYQVAEAWTHRLCDYSEQHQALLDALEQLLWDFDSQPAVAPCAQMSTSA